MNLVWNLGSPHVELPCCTKMTKLSPRTQSVACACGKTVTITRLPKRFTTPDKGSSSSAPRRRTHKKCARRRKHKECIHGIGRWACLRCGPNSTRRPAPRCPCNILTANCPKHGGSNLCPHARQLRSCKLCHDPRYFCCHDDKWTEKRYCAKCDGRRLCPHGKRKGRCNEEECARAQAALAYWIETMRPNSTLPDTGMSKAAFVASNPALPPAETDGAHAQPAAGVDK